MNTINSLTKDEGKVGPLKDNEIFELPLTFAEQMRAEEDLLRRRFVHHTRPRGPMSLQEAMEHCARMEGEPQSRRPMRRIESVEDEMQGRATYDLGTGRYATFDVHAVRKYGLAALLEAEDVKMPTERLPVIRNGRRIGTMAPDFDPATARSTSFMYDVRPGDFRREGDAWVVGRSLGAGDVDCVEGFVRDLDLDTRPTKP